MTNEDKKIVTEIIELNNEVSQNEPKMDSKHFSMKRILTIDESKTSTLILILILLIGLSIFQIITVGDISTNLTELSKVALLSVAGASGLNAISNKGGY